MIRKAERGDWQAISDISRRSGYIDYINWEGISFLDHADVLVVGEEQIRGFSRIEYLPDSAAWFSGLRVDPDFWREGYGAKLTGESITEARKRGCSKARMLVMEDNFKSLKLVDKFGFKEVSRYYFYHGLPDTGKFSEDRARVIGYINTGWKFELFTVDKPGNFRSFSSGGWKLVEGREGTLQIFEAGYKPMGLSEHNGFTCVEIKAGKATDSPFDRDVEATIGIVLELGL